MRARILRSVSMARTVPEKLIDKLLLLYLASDTLKHIRFLVETKLQKLGVEKNKVKESLEKLNGYYFVNIWYPAKEKVHIVNRGWEHLIEEEIVEDKMVILPYKRRAPGQLTKTIRVRGHVRSLPKSKTMK